MCVFPSPHKSIAATRGSSELLRARGGQPGGRGRDERRYRATKRAGRQESPDRGAQRWRGSVADDRRRHHFNGPAGTGGRRLRNRSVPKGPDGRGGEGKVREAKNKNCNGNTLAFQKEVWKTLFFKKKYEIVKDRPAVLRLSRCQNEWENLQQSVPASVLSFTLEIFPPPLLLF